MLRIRTMHETGRISIYGMLTIQQMNAKSGLLNIAMYVPFTNYYKVYNR
jgi:hypothetical protein